MAKIKEKIKIDGTLEKESLPKTFGSNEITVKEVFERVVALETKFDLEVARGRKLGRYFWVLISTLVIVEIGNFIFNYLIYIK